jgi:glutaredoxin
MVRPRAIHVVYAKWCPHCVPIAVDAMLAMAKEFDVPCVLHDIDTDEGSKADDLVRRYGDWTEDYLVPQVFIEFDDAHFEHILTGDPRGLEYTKQAISRFLSSKSYSELKSLVQKERVAK